MLVLTEKNVCLKCKNFSQLACDFSAIHTTKLSCFSFLAMSSYLFIIKYELPEVIRAFMGLEENTGYVLCSLWNVKWFILAGLFQTQCSGSSFSSREWYLNGNYLVLFVSVGIILPLSLLKNLGKVIFNFYFYFIF